MSKDSPKASGYLLDLLDDESSFMECEDAMGETDCPEGCTVEPDGICPHGFKSAGLTLGII